MNTKAPQPAGQPVAPQRFPEELLSSALFLLKRLGMTAKERSYDAYVEAGLHPYHHSILAVLDEGSRETQGAIADALGYDKGQLVGLLDELESAGLIERRRDPNDRRRQTVRITPAAGRRSSACAASPGGSRTTSSARSTTTSAASCMRCSCAWPSSTSRTAACRPRRRPAEPAAARASQASPTGGLPRVASAAFDQPLRPVSSSPNQAGGPNRSASSSESNSTSTTASPSSAPP